MRVLEGNFINRGFANSETLDHFNVCSGKNDGDLFFEIDTVITEIKADGFWNDIGILALLHSNKTDSYRDITGKQAIGTIRAGVSFNAAAGLTCPNGVVAAFISHGSESIPEYALNNAHMWCWGNNVNILPQMRSLSLSTDLRVGSATQHFFYMQSGTGIAVNGGSNGGDGFTGMSVLTASQRYFLTQTTNGSDLVSRTPVFGGSNPFHIGTNGSSAGNGSTYKGWGMGAGLSQTELVQLEGHISAFMTARGL